MVRRVRRSLELDSFHTGIVWPCWPWKVPMANPLAVLGLLNAPDGCDPAYYVFWEVFGRRGGTLVTVLERFIGFAGCWI